MRKYSGIAAIMIAGVITMSTAAKAAEYLLECHYELTLPGEKATDKRSFYVDPASKSIRIEDPESRIKIVSFSENRLEFAQLTAAGVQSFEIDQVAGGLTGEACLGPPAAVDQGSCFIKLKFNGSCQKQDAKSKAPAAKK